MIASPTLWAAVATAEPALPDRSAEQIIADVLAARPMALAGEVRQRVDLGLPDLGMMAGGVDFTEPGSMWELAAGTHTWRIWYDGDRSYRVSIIQGAAESDVICNGSVTWAWSSQRQTAIRDAGMGEQSSPQDGLAIPQRSPDETARELLASIADYSAVSTDSNVRVAGRAAYEVVITPNDDQTRIKQVRMAVDAETSLPLRLQVYSTTSDEPAIEIGYTQLSYSAPNPSVFEFTPPPGAEVMEAGEPEALPGDVELTADQEYLPAEPDSDEPAEPDSDEPVPGEYRTAIGTGWSTVLVVESGSAADSGIGMMLTDQLPDVSGDWGSGRILDGTLVSILFSDDGRIAYGAVPPEMLYRALQ